jgi:hypothetical protein
VWYIAPLLESDKDVMLNWLRRFTRNEVEPAKVYIYQIDHEHDRTYTENIVQYLESQGVLCRSIPLRADGLRPELQLCLDDHATAVLGFNSTLDHSWLPSDSFLAAAEENGTFLRPPRKTELPFCSGSWTIQAADGTSSTPRRSPIPASFSIRTMNGNILKLIAYRVR